MITPPIVNIDSRFIVSLSSRLCLDTNCEKVVTLSQ